MARSIVNARKITSPRESRGPAVRAQLVAGAMCASGLAFSRVAYLRLLAIAWLTGIGACTLLLGSAHGDEPRQRV